MRAVLYDPSDLDVCGLLGFPNGEFGPAVISRIGSKPEITMKTLILAAIRCSLMFLVTASLLSVQSAQAYTVTLQQVGANVVATGSGPINLTGLAFVGPFGPAPGIRGNPAYIMAGGGAGSGGGGVDGYRGVTGPARFGGGGLVAAHTSSGVVVGIYLTGGLFGRH